MKAKLESRGRRAKKNDTKCSAVDQERFVGFKSILVPVDFSERSKAAFDLALRVAGASKAEVHLLNVVENSTSPDFDRFPLARKAASVRAEAKARLAEFARRNPPGEIAVYPEVRCGNAADEIVQAAREEQIDLIIISSHGYTGWRHVLIGSVAERVVRYAPCPVLVLRQNPRAERNSKNGKENYYEN